MPNQAAVLDATPELCPPSAALARLPEEWSARLREWGQPAYRGGQIFRWIHARGVTDPAQMTDLPKALRDRLTPELDPPPLGVARVGQATDRTRKLLVSTADGKEVETVLIPQASAADADDDEPGQGVPVTQCISSQVGCAMGCVFCASGIAGLKRNLTAAEIVHQVLLGRSLLEGGERLRNVVLMGMGEPLHNYDQVARALVLLCHDDGLALSKRRVTLSTSGLVPQIDRLGQDFGGQVQLAISLHAVDDVRRSDLMPINRKHPLPELVAALRRYPLPKRRRITIEYTLIAGVNDDPADADRMVTLLRGVPIKVNLIPMNRVAETALAAPEMARVERFQERLRSHRVPTFIRRRRGDDIAAACGQLALAGDLRRVKRRLGVVASTDE